MTAYELLFDKDFCEYESIAEAKGWHPFSLIFEDKEYNLIFFDSTRLLQEITDVLSRDFLFKASRKLMISFVI